MCKSRAPQCSCVWHNCAGPTSETVPPFKLVLLMVAIMNAAWLSAFVMLLHEHSPHAVSQSSDPGSSSSQVLLRVQGAQQSQPQLPIGPGCQLPGSTQNVATKSLNTPSSVSRHAQAAIAAQHQGHNSHEQSTGNGAAAATNFAGGRIDTRPAHDTSWRPYPRHTAGEVWQEHQRHTQQRQQQLLLALARDKEHQREGSPWQRPLFSRLPPQHEPHLNSFHRQQHPQWQLEYMPNVRRCQLDVWPYSQLVRPTPQPPHQQNQQQLWRTEPKQPQQQKKQQQQQRPAQKAFNSTDIAKQLQPGARGCRLFLGQWV